jgi:pimeloyl-ACP methyl ester carboxylesterase
MTPRLSEWHSRGKFVEVHGHRMFFRDEGEGSAVLLLHGYPTGSFDWHAVWPTLVQDYRLIAPDFHGLGFSAKPREHPYTLSSHAVALDGLLAALGLTRVHVVAHDLGVRVAQEMLARRETETGLALFESLVLLNGAMCPEAYRPRPIQRLLATPLGTWLGPHIPRGAFDRAMRELFGKANQPSQVLLDEFWTLVEHNNGRQVMAAVGRFWRPELAMRERLVSALLRSLVPLRVINGSTDPNSGSHMVNRLLTLSPDVDVVRLDDVGHWPQIEAAQTTATAIMAFWKSLSSHLSDPVIAATSKAAEPAFKQPSDAAGHVG